MSPERITRKPPDHSDPFKPPTPPVEVICLHCGERYCSNLMRWDGLHELWVCKNWPICNGAGVAFDVCDVTDAPEGLKL